MAIGARATAFLLQSPGLQRAVLRPISGRVLGSFSSSSSYGPAGRGQHRASTAAVTPCLAAACAALGRVRRGQRRWSSSRHRSQHRVALQSRGGSTHHKSEAVPVLLLSGFLGAGKTTLLQHWLLNSDKRIGVVVNDMSSVNIDAKLVKQQSRGALSKVETIQLENGCACCSLGDELITTINDLVQLSERDEPFSLIIVELSGVAEPQRVRENFERASLTGLEEFTQVQLDKIVTLVDSSTFSKDYMEFSRIYDRPDLIDDNDIDMGEMVEAKVVELLVEQIEEANVVVLNKVDMAEDGTLPATRAVIKALNEKAVIHETSFGRISLDSILVAPQEEVHAASHSHEHGHGGHASHGEEEGHGSGHAHSCSKPDCADPECTEHSHGHSHSHAEECSDPDCTDPSHGHSHSHSSAATTAEERFGIHSFTYRARRPFDSDRLAAMLEKWPVPKKDCLGKLLGAPNKGDSKSPFSRVIRSKGFCWMDTYPSNRMYWSHAGKHLGLDFDWPWWGSLPQEELEQIDKERPLSEYRRALKEDWCDEWADRRQEIVFIGQKMDEARIRELLDGCLIQDGPALEAYREKQDKDTQKNSLNAWEAIPGA